MRPPSTRQTALLVAALLSLLSATASAQANPSERVYVVRPNDTLARIAARLGVPLRALAERNHLAPPYRLQVGRRLRLPEGVAREVLRRLPTRAELASGAPRSNASAGGEAQDAASSDGAARGHRPGFVTMVRQRDGAVLATNFAVNSQSLRVRVERFLRFRDGSRHGIHPRLIRTLAAVSDHFDGRRIMVLSGFRPHLRDPSRPRSRHSRGYAVDARVEGVSTRALFDFCASREGLGCGLYPRGGFVHIDVRVDSEAWTDGSARGQRNRRNAAHEDETVDEVLADAEPVR